jgi:hypothetical protein
VLDLLTLLACTAVAPPNSLEGQRHASVELVEHALRATPDDVHLDEVIVDSSGRQVRGVARDREAAEAFMTGLAIGMTPTGGWLEAPETWAMAPADHLGVDVTRVWAFQELGGEHPGIEAARSGLDSLQNTDIRFLEVRRYGHDLVADGVATSREDLARWLEIAQHSPCLRDVAIEVVEPEPGSGATLFWLRVDMVRPFALAEQCVPDPGADDSAALSTLVTHAEGAGFEVVTEPEPLSGVLRRQTVEVSGDLDALLAWGATADTPPLDGIALRRAAAGFTLQLDLVLRVPVEDKDLRKALRWHERRSGHEISDEVARGELLSMARRIDRDDLRTLLQRDRELRSLHELEGKDYTSVLPDDVATRDTAERGQWHMDLMLAEGEMLKRDFPEPPWRQVEMIASKLGLEEIQTRPLAPMLLSRYLVGLPMRIEARADEAQLDMFVDRLSRLPRRSDRSQLRIVRRDADAELVGIVVFVVARAASRYAPDLVELAGAVEGMADGRQDPFSPGPGLLESLADPEQVETVMDRVGVSPRR